MHLSYLGRPGVSEKWHAIHAMGQKQRKRRREGGMEGWRRREREGEGGRGKEGRSEASHDSV